MGGIEIQLAYYRGYGEFKAAPWAAEAEVLQNRMTSIRCAAGQTQIARVLKHALGPHLPAPPRPDPSPTLPPALPRTKPAAAPSTLRTDGLTLVQASFNLIMGWLNMRERAKSLSAAPSPPST